MKERQLELIKAHGEILINAFKCVDEDPVRLCKALRRLEKRAIEITTDLCNGDLSFTIGEPKLNKILESVNILLNQNDFDIPIFINTDPRGYALKIDDEFLRKCDKDSTFQKIPRDMGGYGLIAPEIKGDEDYCQKCFAHKEYCDCEGDENVKP